MPLSTAKLPLKFAIFDALEKARETIDVGAEDGTAPTDINMTLATDLAKAIHSYTTQAVVNTSTTAVVVGIAAPASPAGVEPVAGAALGTGVGTINN